MKILIAVPTYETIYPDTFKSIWDWDKCGHNCVFEFIRGYDVAAARNNISKKAIEIDADYVLMVDNDVVLPLDALKNLLESPKDVQLGYYAHRDKHNNVFDGRTIVFDVDYSHNFMVSDLNNLKEQGKYKVLIRGGGMGCALIKTDVFRKMRFPYFVWVNFTDGKRECSEDIYFCDQCKALGIQVYTDTRVNCGHIFRYIQTC